MGPTSIDDVTWMDPAITSCFCPRIQETIPSTDIRRIDESDLRPSRVCQELPKQNSHPGHDRPEISTCADRAWLFPPKAMRLVAARLSVNAVKELLDAGRGKQEAWMSAGSGDHRLPVSGDRPDDGRPREDRPYVRHLAERRSSSTSARRATDRMRS